MSTGDEHDDVLIEEDHTSDVGTSDIDKVLELVHELKQKDLNEYKKKIDLKNKSTMLIPPGNENVRYSKSISDPEAHETKGELSKESSPGVFDNTVQLDLGTSKQYLDKF